MRRPLFAAGFALAALLALFLAWNTEDPPDFVEDLAFHEGATVVLTGRVCQKEESSYTLQSITFYSLDSEFQEAAVLQRKISNRKKIICEQQGDTVPTLGSIVTVQGTFALFSEASNPGEFDAAVYYRSIGVLGRVRKTAVLSEEKPAFPVREGLFRLRCFWTEKLYRIFPEKEAAVMCALLLGDRGSLDEELKGLYKRNGILHILSISSLHITILGMGLYRILRRVGMPIWAAALVGGAGMLLYGVMTGFGISVCRAIGMYLLRMLAECTGRTYDMLNSLGAAGVCMLLYNVYYLQNSGFLLSFSSILGIGVVYPGILHCWGKGQSKAIYGESRWQKGARFLGQALRENLFLSAAITLTTLPVQLWFYYEVPVFGVIINLLVLPFVKPLLIMGICALVLPFGGLFAGADSIILGWYELLCGLFDGLSFAVWNPGRPALWRVVLYYGVLGGCLFLGSREKKRKRERVRGQRGALLGILGFALLIIGIRGRAENRLVFLNVGQGDCALVRTAAGQNFLFDCGSSSRSKVGEYVLLPYLKYSGIRKLDGIFLSHPDEDHVNGALELLALAGENRIQISQLVLPDIAAAEREEELGELMSAARTSHEGLEVRLLAAGEGWSSGETDFLCLHPAREYAGDNSNEYSLCIYAAFGGVESPEFSVLFTGDVEGEGEQELLEQLKMTGIDAVSLLKVAHHGSKNSTSAEFLKQIKPQTAVISCGENNSYGHPHEETLARLEDAGVQYFVTADTGAVAVRVEKYKNSLTNDNK